MPLTTAEKSKRYRERLKNNPEKYKISLAKSRARSAQQYRKKMKEIDESKINELRLTWRQQYASKNRKALASGTGPVSNESKSEKDAGPSSSTSTQREAASAEDGTPLNSDDDVSDDAAESESGDDLSLYLSFPKKSAESITPERKNFPDKRSDLRNDGFECNICGRDIIGYRYTCVQCPQFNLCSACEAKGEHCLHYVLRIPKSAPFAEAQSMLNAIRCQLLYGGSKQPEPDTEPDTQEESCVETLKLEIKEEPDPLQIEDQSQADHHYLEKNTASPMPAETTQPIQTSQTAYDTAMTAEMLEGNTLLIIENPVSASSAAAHTAAGADRTKRKLAHRSTEPPHVSEKRVRVTHAPAQDSANLLIEEPITGTVPVTTVPQSPAAVLVTAVPHAAGTSATGGREVKKESTFQVFSYSKIEPKKPRAKPGQSAGKASTPKSFLTRLI